MGELLDNLKARTQRRACAAGSVLDHPDHGRDFAEALELHKTNPAMSYVAISAALQEFGIEVSPDLIAKHCRGRCKCNG